MDTDKNLLKAKQIAAKYRFAELEDLSKEELLIKYKELYKEFSDLQSELGVALEKVRLIESSKTINASKVKYLDYNPQIKGIEKVLYILNENNKIMLSKEILSEILLLEPSQTFGWRTPYSAVMKYITRAVKAKRIVKYKVATIGFTYGLPEWFDGNGNLQNAFSK